jgi:hypothetical protein
MLDLFFIPLFMYNRIRDENCWDPVSGSRIKNLGIRDKTSRIRNTGGKAGIKPEC